MYLIMRRVMKQNVILPAKYAATVGITIWGIPTFSFNFLALWALWIQRKGKKQNAMQMKAYLQPCLIYMEGIYKRETKDKI